MSSVCVCALTHSRKARDISLLHCCCYVLIFLHTIHAFGVFFHSLCFPFATTSIFHLCLFCVYTCVCIIYWTVVYRSISVAFAFAFAWCCCFRKSLRTCSSTQCPISIHIEQRRGKKTTHSDPSLCNYVWWGEARGKEIYQMQNTRNIV